MASVQLNNIKKVYPYISGEDKKKNKKKNADEPEKKINWHDILRMLQWLIPELFAFYGVLDKIFGWGYADTLSTIVSALVGLLGNMAQHSSKTFFATKAIVEKHLTTKEKK